ncbi:MAG: hypothetical protein WA102_14220 [Candidatus Methanoperedens sp.]
MASINRVWMWLKENKDNINTLASITTIFALGIALVTFYDAKSQETDYRLALTSELIHEIDFNLNHIDGMQNIREKLTTTFEEPTYKFSTVILEEALRNGKIGNITTKKEMFDALLIMHTLNNLMDEPIYDINGSNTLEGYMKMKKERYDLILKENERLKLLFQEIKNALTSPT